MGVFSMVKKSRRDLLVKSGIAVGAIGLSSLYQNCSDSNLTVAQNASSGLIGGNALQPYTANAGTTSIDGQIVTEATTGSDLDIFVDFTLATHDSHADMLGSHEQHLLSVIAGRNRVTPYAQKWRTNKSADTVLAIIVYDKFSGSIIRCHRFNASSNQVDVLMMVLDAMLGQTRTISVVVHHATRGFLKRDFTMSKNLAAPYLTLVAPFNSAQPFAGANPIIHYPLIEILTEDSVRITLGGVSNRHPRIAEDHYIAGAALYDQDGHIIALTTSVPYGDIVNFSIVNFTRAAIHERGITQLRTVVHDTSNGYLMGFLNV